MPVQILHGRTPMGPVPEWKCKARRRKKIPSGNGSNGFTVVLKICLKNGKTINAQFLDTQPNSAAGLRFVCECDAM